MPLPALEKTHLSGKVRSREASAFGHSSCLLNVSVAQNGFLGAQNGFLGALLPYLVCLLPGPLCLHAPCPT